MVRRMKRSDFSFELPPELIAQHPPPNRGDSRLMWCEQKPSFEITAFQRIVEAFRGDEVLVVNDTRVVPARFFGHKESGGRVEVFLLNAWTNIESKPCCVANASNQG